MAIINEERTFNIDRVALLYRDLLSSSFHKLTDEEQSLLLSAKQKNKIIAVGDIDTSNWNAYPLTWLLQNKLVAPTVLDESKIYQSVQAMRTCNTSIMHPQNLISESVVIRIVGLDSSPNMNEYLNTFISMCIAADKCKVVFIIIDCDKRSYKNNIYTRKYNSSFIDYSSADKSPVKIEGTPLAVSPDDVLFFNYSKKLKSGASQNKSTALSNATSRRKSANTSTCASMINEPDFI